MPPRKDAGRSAKVMEEDFNPTLWEADPDVEVKLRTCSQAVPLGLKIEGGPDGAVFVEGVEPGLWASRTGVDVPCEIVSLSTEKTSGPVNVKLLSQPEFVNMMMTRPLTFTFGALRLRQPPQRDRSRSRSRERTSLGNTSEPTSVEIVRKKEIERKDASEDVEEQEILEGECWGVATSITIKKVKFSPQVHGFGTNMYEDFAVRGLGMFGGVLNLIARNSSGDFKFKIQWNPELRMYVGKTLNQGYAGGKCSFSLLKPVAACMPSPTGSFRKRVTSIDTAALSKALSRVGASINSQDQAFVSHDEIALNRQRVMRQLVTEGWLPSEVAS